MPKIFHDPPKKPSAPSYILNVRSLTQGAVNRNVKAIKSTRKSRYTKYTSKRRFQIAKYANETGCSAAVGNSNHCFLI